VNNLSNMLHAIINSKKTKYSILQPLVEKNLPKDTKELTVFISLECILKQFYNPRVNETINSLEIPEKHLLSSELINIVAHYRHFFWSRYGVPSTYFVYYSSERATYNILESEGYRKNFYEKRVDNTLEYGNLNKMVRKNLDLANLLSEYLPNIYFIDTKDFDPSALPHFILRNNQGDGITNIVLSNNVIDYQMVNNDRTFAITLQGDNSSVIRRENLMELFLKDSKKKSSTVLSSHLYIPVYAISGHKTFNVDGIKGMGKLKTIALLEKALANGEISNGIHKTMEPISRLFDKGDSKLINSNFNVLDYGNLCGHITPKQLDNIRMQIDNKSDNQSLMEINHQYYEKYPLMLIELMEGEQ
jgi:hypothetical protein